jgi:hypothetical protein
MLRLYTTLCMLDILTHMYITGNLAVDGQGGGRIIFYDFGKSSFKAYIT